MNHNNLRSFLRDQVLDIRQTGNARFMDQKCTPDVLSTIAECIQNYTSSAFCVRDIWQSEFAASTVMRFFQKPNTSDERSSNEYDKFFGQPIKLLEYARVIEIDPEHQGRSNYYKVVQPNILNHIAVSDRKAFDFLTIYLNEVLFQSGILTWFEDFFLKQNEREYAKLKTNFENFIIKYTPINQRVEVRRIFTKILNPLAVERNKAGTRRGRFSNDNILYDELLYNRLNFRDLDKPKNMPRAVFLEQQPELAEHISYNVEKAKRQVKLYQGTKSEVHPNLYGEANHAHHIFPQSNYLELSDTLENLIVLTAEEHYEFAHSNSSTSVVSPSYQMVCLLSKVESIKKSIFEKSDGFYSLDSFSNVIESGLNTSIYYYIHNDLEQSFNRLSYGIIKTYFENVGTNPYNVNYGKLQFILYKLMGYNNLTLSENVITEVNNLFGTHLIKSQSLGAKHTLNLVAEYALG